MSRYLLQDRTPVHAAWALVALVGVACLGALGACTGDDSGDAPDVGAAGCVSDDECRQQRLDWVCEQGRCQAGCVFDQDCAQHGLDWGCVAGHCRPRAASDAGPDQPDLPPGADLGSPVIVCDPPCEDGQVCSRGRCLHRCQAPLECADDAVVDLGGVSVDAYEASRPDASDTELGCNRNRACSVGGRVPWTALSWTEASDACEAAGKRLCSEADWRRACEGLEGRRFPYGDTFDATACNGAGQGRGSPWPTGSGPDCVSLQGIYDLSGNVHEWVGDELGERQRGTLGGNYQSNMTQSACDYALRQEDMAARDVGVGFRCCR